MYNIKDVKMFRSNVVNSFKFINDNMLQKNIEIGIFNNCINECIIRKIVKKWDNEYFVLLYVIDNSEKIQWSSTSSITSTLSPVLRSYQSNAFLPFFSLFE